MSVSPNIQAIICEEIFDESSHPSAQEINEYASKIGIDPKSEPHLLHLAKEGLMQALPLDWKPCYDEKSKSYYYYNSQSGRTQWEHPLDDMYRNLVQKVRSESQASVEEDSKGHEDHTYTKEDLQSYEESLSKPFAMLPLSPIKKLDPINLGARKKELRLSPAKVKSKSMQDFTEKSTEFGNRKNGRSNTFSTLDHGLEKSVEVKSALPKNDKHPNSIEKGELTLSGGGSMFLKSNTKKLISQNSDSQLDNGAASGTKSLETEYLPKSILRDRSLPETYSAKEFAVKEIQKLEPEDDKKSVRFNLETTNQEIEFSFSESEQKSSSEEEIEVFATTKTKKPDVLVQKSRFTVSPVLFDEYGPNFIKPDGIFAKIEHAEKLEENSSPRNSNLKLIKPNPIDFITPKIIGKPLDVIKPISLLSDSDDESASKFKAKFPKDDAIITEKLSNVQDSIPEEITEKSEVSVEEKIESKNVEPEKIIEIDLEKHRQELTKENKQQIEILKQSLLEQKQIEIERLKNSILESQKTEMQEILANEKIIQEDRLKTELEKLKDETDVKYKLLMEQEEQNYQLKLNKRKAELELNFNIAIEEIEKSFREKEKEIENNFQMSLKQTETDFILKLEERIKEISLAHKAVLDRMKDDHELTLAELLRDFKSEEEIIRKEHQQNLSDLKDKISQELEIEKQKMRELGEDRLYEKVRCEKRLLEDKYRCLKEKYIRLKSDVKVSLERRNRRKEQSLTTTTGSDTERSTSHKKGSISERVNVNTDVNKKNNDRQFSTPKHLSKSNRIKANNKNVQHIIIEDLDTSISDRSSKQNNLDNDKDKDRGFDSSDGISNHGRSRRKLFTRLKSNSTSRLNNNASKNKEMKRSCSPVENLRRQLQKLEDLEDQFPQTAPTDTYHLRYPFTDAVPGDIAGSSELEFFRHRIHLERDSVRRAKESLRTQKTNFQKRQRELKLRHGSAARNTVQQLYQEERELSDMEVSLHRTRSLLGEKVIRLRHLEQSLQRLSSSNKQDDATLSDLSSHSASSGISSTEFATATDNNFANGRNVHFREEHLQESSEIMQSLENLNSEIREIWDVLNKQQHAANVTTIIPPVPLVYSDHVWPVAPGNVTLPTLNAIPTLADRLHEYHQRAALASQGVQSIVVSQPPRAAQGASVTTTLVERTKNLRDWLRQAKAEQGEIANPGQTTL